MAKRTIGTLPTMAAGSSGWDTASNDADSLLKAFLEDGALGLYERAELEAEPAASSNDRGILAKEVRSGEWRLELSNGTSWLVIPVRATHVSRLTDNSGGTAGSSVESTGSGTADNNFATILAKLDAIQDALEASDAMADS